MKSFFFDFFFGGGGESRKSSETPMFTDVYRKRAVLHLEVS